MMGPSVVQLLQQLVLLWAYRCNLPCGQGWALCYIHGALLQLVGPPCFYAGSAVCVGRKSYVALYVYILQYTALYSSTAGCKPCGAFALCMQRRPCTPSVRCVHRRTL
jgi:hypothetical protein